MCLAPMISGFAFRLGAEDGPFSAGVGFLLNGGFFLNASAVSGSRSLQRSAAGLLRQEALSGAPASTLATLG